jgi:hypothetical protein
MRPLIAWLFTDKPSITLNPTRQLACRIPGCINCARWVFQDDEASAHRAKGMKELHNAVRVTVSGANLHLPTNSAYLSPIEQMW